MGISGMPVIDAHVHTGHYMNIHYKAEHLLQLVQGQGINFSLCASYSSGTIGQAAGTAEVAAIAEHYPERIGGLVWVVPVDPNWEHDATQALYAGFYGIFLNPAVDCYRVETDLLRPIFQFAHEHSWPVLVRLDKQHAQASAFAPLLQEFPDLPLVFCDLHSFDELLIATRHPNVLVATGTLTPEYIGLAAGAAGADHIIWGSGLPIGYYDPVAPATRNKRKLTLLSDESAAAAQPDSLLQAAERYASQAQGVLELKLAEADLEAIFYGNARRVFGLDQLQL